MPRLPRVKAVEVMRALEKRGYLLSRTRGSHYIYRHPESGRRVVVPYHGARIIPPGTVANILKQADVSVDEFVEMLRG